ncbi:Nudix-related transcriptional regulator NrtR [hydrothermal vent metagenome]|uniref:Nudix-related transcriptional regulator NrtR n=1 Tax=hydrothermal vent metagenome TaxID=652676 RepID=A0A3B0YFZ3_9ZZZZ
MKLSRSEKEFLKNYNIHEFDVPLASVDLCIFSIIDDSLKVLLIKRGDYPFKARWALPGGFVDTQQDKSLEATAIRKLKEKTGVKTPYVEQVETIGTGQRDPRGWSMTVLYFALLAAPNELLQPQNPQLSAQLSTQLSAQSQQVQKPQVKGSQETIQWVSIQEAKDIPLAFDHLELLDKAIIRLRNKVSYTTLPIHILPKQFTLAELQKAYEIIMGRKVEKKSFRRRIDAADLLVETGELLQDGGRPAKLYYIKAGAETHFYNRTI